MTEPVRKRILVVDDDAMNREIMEAFLTSENYDVELAHDGGSALEMAPHLQPDLILLDVKMPDISGFDVCEQLKQHADTASIAIVIVTGFDAPQDRERAMQVGADAFLSRPFSGDDLLHQVSSLLQD